MTELPGPWERIFYDGTDAAGRRHGAIEDRRLISAVPCIGCRIHETDPAKAMSRTYEVWVNGQREFDHHEGCHCDAQAAAGLTPWRLTPVGTLVHRDRVCLRCGGHGTLCSQEQPQRSWECDACRGTGWAGGSAPWAVS